MKTKIFILPITLLIIALFFGCKKDTFVEVPGVCPEVILTSPVNGATSVVLNKVITATFNEVMNAATITQASFIIMKGTALKETATTPVLGIVTYTGTTASFTPSSLLAPNTNYYCTIKTLAKDLNGNALQEDYEWAFSTSTIPAVSSTIPLNLATNVTLNQVISFTFSEAMDAATITAASTFTLKQGTNLIAGSVLYSGTTGTFTPSSNLLPNTLYTATISTAAKNLAGNSIASNYIWTFTTSKIPTVLSVDPLDLATNVALDKVISAKFSELMDAATITAPSTFTLKQGTNIIAGSVSYTVSDSTAKFTPSSNLLPNTLYTATISTAAKNTAGNSIASNYVWTFTTSTIPTVISTDPVNLATNVALNKVITATFSEAMNSSTITAASTFTLKQGTTPIAGSVVYSGTTASFTPNVNLLPGNTYTATISTAAKNLAGQAIVSDYIWSFTTSTIPTVISTDPVNLATNVALNKVITATFSEAMNSSTITAASTFTLKQGTTPIAGSVVYSGTTASFTPNVNLLPGNTYTATISTAAMNLAGNSIVSDYIWSFTTINQFTLTVIAVNGTVSKNPDQLVYDNGTTVTLTANPNVNYVFTSWSGDAIGISSTKQILMNANKTVTANFTLSSVVCTPAVDLGLAGDYVILAQSGISTTGVTAITGDLGISPAAASSITGFGLILPANGAFSSSSMVTGNIYAADYAAPTPDLLTTAITNMTTAYTTANGLAPTVPAELLAGNLNSQTLAPGVYKWGTGVTITTGLTLDGGGDPCASWVFQIAGDLTVANGTIITLSNGANAKNIFWVVAGSKADLGTTVNFKGNILCKTLISLNTGASVLGRLISQTAVTLNANTVVLPQ